jgi:thiol-disulfide isomerase/thioredoxin
MFRFKLFSISALAVASSLFTCFSSPSIAAVDTLALEAGKTLDKSRQGRLAPSLQGKPVVVDIYASWCPGCRNIAPTLSQLRTQYGDRVHFVVFDVTDRNTTAVAAAKARELGLSAFFEAHKAQTSTVAIIDPSNGRVIKQLRNNPNINAYSATLDAEVRRLASR